MEQSCLDSAILRIRRMEACFDAALTTGTPSPELVRYLESGQWLRDYELDEQGMLPPDLKRGVLSQDALYDLLSET